MGAVRDINEVDPVAREAWSSLINYFAQHHLGDDGVPLLPSMESTRVALDLIDQAVEALKGGSPAVR